MKTVFSWLIVLAGVLLFLNVPVQADSPALKDFQGSFVQFQYPEYWQIEREDGPEVGIQSVVVSFSRYDECAHEKAKLLEFTFIASTGPKETYTVDYLKENSMLLSIFETVSEKQTSQLGHITEGVGLEVTGEQTQEGQTLRLGLLEFLKILGQPSVDTQRYFSFNGYYAQQCNVRPALTTQEQADLNAFLSSIELSAPTLPATP